jgi:hypothetical protein
MIVYCPLGNRFGEVGGTMLYKSKVNSILAVERANPFLMPGLGMYFA